MSGNRWRLPVLATALAMTIGLVVAPAMSASSGSAPAAARINLGYFVQWGVYQRNYHVKNIETSGSADKLTHINYAFGNVTERPVRDRRRLRRLRQVLRRGESVDGVADTWDAGALRGNFNQLAS